MSRMAVLAGAVLGGLVVAALLWRRQAAREVRTRAERVAAILAVIDTSKGPGWVETFQSPQTRSLSDHDRRWRPIFGQLLVDPRRGAMGDPEGGWERDGGDDYAFRAVDVPGGSVEIVVDGWWDGDGSIGVQGAVQASPPHQLYEAALWRGRLALIYFSGPAPDQFETLAESSEWPVGAGYYRIAFRMEKSGSRWLLRARLLNPAAGYAILAEATASDDRLPGGGQGIGILGGGASSFISGIAVKALQDATPSQPAS